MRIELPERGLHLEVESHGEPTAPTLVMVMGLGLQLIAWPDALINRLVDAGYRVLVFDNRDCGLSGSTHRPDYTPPRRAMLAHLLRRPFRPAYDLGDMAADTLALAEALGIERFHVLGVSLGGMVAQTLAARWPQRVLSLVSIMSNAGPDTAPWPAPHVLWAFLRRPPRNASPRARVAHGAALLATLGCLKDSEEIVRLHARVERATTRAWRPDGVARQLLASLVERDRSQEVARIRCPTLILHGTRDPLIRLPAAHRLQQLIPHAHLQVLEGMGHYLPQSHLPAISDALLAHLAGAQREIP